jgi:tetratricopeptide (TPR) repeat protein
VVGHGAVDTVKIQARIAAEAAAVAAEPKDARAWVRLGNDYFDTMQRQKAVDAYDRALALTPDDPDVLTDRGIMYRYLEDLDRAVADFQRASKVAPKHARSLYNLGMVYAYDLRQPDKAIEAWSRLLEVAPGSHEARDARQEIQSLQRRVKPPEL